MSRFGDSRHATAPTWSFSTDSRPLVGTSRTYQGREIEKQNDCRIGSSPGPCYNPKPGLRVGTFGPAYAFGHVRTTLDKRVSPGPGNYGHAQAPSFGAQRVDSTRNAKPVWGMGSSTRDDQNMLHLAKYHCANLPSRSLLGGHISAEIAKPPAKPPASAAASKKNLSRAMAVAMAANQAESDPELAAALSVLAARVSTLRAQAGEAEAAS